MTETSTRLHITAGTRRITLVGSESFVAAQVERFGEEIRGLLGAAEPNDRGASHKDLVGSSEAENGKEGEKQSLQENLRFPKVFDVTEAGIEIIPKVPGDNDAEKTVNAALLCVLARKSEGKTVVPFAEIRGVCDKKGFLNESNFASYIQNKAEYFKVTGTPKKKAAEFRDPGLEAAIMLAKKLSENKVE